MLDHGMTEKIIRPNVATVIASTHFWVAVMPVLGVDRLVLEVLGHVVGGRGVDVGIVPTDE